MLRGIGGERQFLERYVERSQQVRRAGVRVAGPQAVLDGAHVLLPGVFVVVLTWLGAHAVLAGRLSAGELVTIYGFAAFRITGYYFAGQYSWNKPCSGSDRCIAGYFTRFVDLSERFTYTTDGPDLGAAILRLIR